MSHSGDVEGPVLPSVPPPPVHKVRAEDIVTEVGKKAGKDESSQCEGSLVLPRVICRGVAAGAPTVPVAPRQQNIIGAQDETCDRGVTICLT